MIARVDHWIWRFPDLPSNVWAEFGVARGGSARALLRRLPLDGQLHLFDWFRGLPEDWDQGSLIRAKGSHACAVPEFNDPRVCLHIGLFNVTVPQWQAPPLGLLHIDCDLYQSTRDVLFNLPDTAFVPGTVIVFDEYKGYGTAAQHEARAFREWRAERGYAIDWQHEQDGNLTFDGYQRGGILRKL